MTDYITGGKGLEKVYKTRKFRIDGYVSFGGFAPESLFDEYAEAEDLALSDGDPVSSWAGRNGVDTATQGVTASQPVFEAEAGLYRKPAVVFDGIDDYLEANALASLFNKASTDSDTKAMTVVMVYSSVDRTADNFIYGAGNSTSNDPIFGMDVQEDGRHLVRSDGGLTFLLDQSAAGFVRTDTIISLARFDPSDDTWDLWVGDTKVGDALRQRARTDTMTFDRFALGALPRTSVGNHASVKLYAWGVLSGVMADEDVTSVLEYLNDKYKREETPPVFSGITGYDWSARSVEAQTDGTNVTSLTDRFSGTQVSQATSTKQPKKQTRDGYPVLDFDGTDDELLGDFDGDLLSGHTFFIVERFNASASGNPGSFKLYEGAEGTADHFQAYKGGTNYIMLTGRQAGVQARFYASGVIGQHENEVVQMNTGVFYSPEGTSDGRGFWAGRILRDDQMGLPSTISGSDPTKVKLGIGYNTFMDGQIYEILLYDAPLTNDQIEVVWEWLELEWNSGSPFPD